MPHEEVIMAVPEHLSELRKAAELFARQYHCRTCIQVRGSLLEEGKKPYRAENWVTISQVDEELDLLGLGSPEEENEERIRMGSRESRCSITPFSPWGSG